MKGSSFPLGNIVVTKGIDELMTTDPTFNRFVTTCLKRYAKCDWGDTCEDDRKQADWSVKNGELVLAVYNEPGTDQKIWIITEWDRSTTTVLFPDEY